MAELASFWVGNQLGPIEVASLRSFLRHGDSMTVYSYAPIEGMPAGIEWRPAAEIMPSQQIIRHHRTGSPALHSDLFRYHLMDKTNKIWVDLDVIALRSFDFPGEWVFGYETSELVATAVLRLPRSSDTLRKLLEIKVTTTGIPPYIKGFRYAKYWLRTGGRGLTIDKWPWGAIGPRLLTYYLEQSNETQHAMPIDTFYPVRLQDAAWFAEPGKLTRDDLPQDTWAVHLWGSKLRKIMDERYGGAVPPNSFLDRALRGDL